MNQAVVEDLVAEMADLLDVGEVGLYEFLDSLRGDHPEMTEADLREHANAALKLLLVDGRNRLVWSIWARPDLTREAKGATPTPQDWGPLNDDLDDPYLAIAPGWYPLPPRK